MPSKKQYNLVNDDAYDSRIPLYNEDAFQHGIIFHAKYIGSLDIPRPSNRLEIVAAMRRTRYEYKAKSIKKKKVIITVSIEGVKISIRHKKKSNQWPWDENKFIIMQHPIYRIFYVSHDSQDMKIFSYIARDGGSNAFRCNVFKSKKNSQAMRIVRTIGQAFEVCHKMSLALSSSSIGSPLQEDITYSQLADHIHKGDGASEPNSSDIQTEEALSLKPREANGVPPNVNSVNAKKHQNESPSESKPEDSSSAMPYQIQVLKDQLNEQNQQLLSAFNQMQLLKDQLSAETSARLQTQAENQQLLAYNRELLEHILKQVQHFRDIEQRYHVHESDRVEFLPEPSSFPKPLQLDGVKKKNVSIVERSRPEGLSASSPLEQGPENNTSGGTHFGRQHSSSSMNFPLACSSPRFPCRDSTMTGLSLPGSPFQCNSPIELDTYTKSRSPMNSLRKSKKLSDRDSLPHHISSSSSNAKTDDRNFKFDFPPQMSNHSSLPMKGNNSVDVPHTSHSIHDRPFHSKYAQNFDSNESFIKQITRDLAKLDTKCDVDPTQSSYEFAPLFES